MAKRSERESSVTSSAIAEIDNKRTSNKRRRLCVLFECL